MSDGPVDHQNAATDGAAEDEERSTGLPVLRSWPSLYFFVLAAFVVMVVLLTLFTIHFTRATS